MALSWALLAAGCSMDARYDGTSFRCDLDQACPPGLECQDGTCQPAGDGLPVAAFTQSTDGLTVELDASGSTDPDGSIEAYDWSLGDGTTAMGSLVTHTFDAPGTYAITLTVTDDDGNQDEATAEVTLGGVQPYVLDRFDREVSDGWGTADVGGSWLGVSGLSVTGGAGRIELDVPTDGSQAAIDVSAADVDITALVSSDIPGTGGGIYVSLVARRVGEEAYTLKLILDDSVGAALILDQDGDEKTLDAGGRPLTYTGGAAVRVRYQVQGTSPTVLRAKVWQDGEEEPNAWQVEASDTTTSLQTAGTLGVWAYLSASAEAEPVTVAVDDLRVDPLVE